MQTEDYENTNMDGDFNVLPEDCKAKVLSLTSPRDACRSSLVSQMFKSVAESDAVWEQFLPQNYQIIISRYASALRFESKKELFFHLCHTPVLIDDNMKSFWLDKWSGKKCYMLSARDLMIAWGDTPQYWEWISIPEARFSHVAALNYVCWLEIRGKIDIRMLSPTAVYTTLLVYKISEYPEGLDYPAEAEIGLVGSERYKQIVCLGITQADWWQCEHITSIEMPTNIVGQYPRVRADGWYEVELGDFDNKGVDEGELEISLLEIKGGHAKFGLIVQGIEVRPKRGQ